jgi:hypothetical protein
MTSDRVPNLMYWAGDPPGIRSNKKTHINCGSSACMSDIMSVNENQIRRQGRGNNTTMKGISHQSCPHTPPTMCALCTLYFKPRFGLRTFFSPFLIFAPSSPRHYFLLPIVILFNPRRQTNERTNERTVTLPFSRHVTITNILPFASILFLLTLDRLQQWRRR